MTYERFDVVVVPFPFTDRTLTKRRPTLVLSGHGFNRQAGHSVMAMITSAKNAPWPSDVSINDLGAAGLPAESMVRMKLFTLDHRLVISKCGSLAGDDRVAVEGILKGVLEL